MRLNLTENALEVDLSAAEKVFAVHGDVVVPYDRIASVELDPDPVATAGMGWANPTWVGLRTPRVRYLCTSGFGRAFWNVRRGQPAVRVRLRKGRLRELNLGADDAASLVDRIAERIR
jgi:hypothetical protein